jgi:hypothetical protein
VVVVDCSASKIGEIIKFDVTLSQAFWGDTSEKDET